jgi:hypothetical protein
LSPAELSPTQALALYRCGDRSEIGLILQA